MKISIRNFKRLGRQAQEFHLAPLTYMLGANTTRKISLFQLLLALRQSIEAGRWLELLPRGPAVDLGSFRNFVHRHDLDSTVVLRLSDRALGTLEINWNSERDGNRGGCSTSSSTAGPQDAETLKSIPNDLGVSGANKRHVKQAVKILKDKYGNKDGWIDRLLKE